MKFSTMRLMGFPFLVTLGYWVTNPYYQFVDWLYDVAITLKYWKESSRIRRLSKQLPKAILIDPNDPIVDPYNNYARVMRDDWNKGHQPMILGTYTVTTEEEAKRLLPKSI